MNKRAIIIVTFELAALLFLYISCGIMYSIYYDKPISDEIYNELRLYEGQPCNLVFTSGNMTKGCGSYDDVDEMLRTITYGRNNNYRLERVTIYSPFFNISKVKNAEKISWWCHSPIYKLYTLSEYIGWYFGCIIMNT